MARPNSARLNYEQAAIIRRQYKERCPTCGHNIHTFESIAAEHGVSPVSIWNVVSGKTYREPKAPV